MISERRQELVDLIGDTHAAMMALQKTIKYLGKENSCYPELLLAESVLRRVWVSASNEAVDLFHKESSGQ